jgi:hypothetical protein
MIRFDEDLVPEDGPCAQCGCLLSVHYIGIDGLDIRNCPNYYTCGCQRPSDKPTEFFYAGEQEAGK